jgi:WD40 repeat protein
MSRFGTIGTQYFDDAGDPLVSGLLYFYETGTTTAKTTYADVNLTIPNTNPVVLSASGRQPNVFFDGVAKVILTSSDYVQVEVRDPVGGSTDSALQPWVSAVGYDIDAVVLGSDGNFYQSLASGNIGNDPTTATTAWVELKIITAWNASKSYDVDALSLGSDGGLYRSVIASNLNNNPTANDLTKWELITEKTTGDLVISGDLDKYYAPYWLECDGTAYDSTTYALLYNKIGGQYVKLATPATVPGANERGCAIQAGSALVSFASVGTPYVTNYTLISDVLTKLTNPATLPTGAASDCAYSADGQFLAVSHAASPFVTIYTISGTTFTKLANPATLPTGTGNGVAFSADGQFLAVAHATSPFVTVYSISGTTFTKLANPATLPPDTCNGVAFSTDGSLLFVAHATTPFVTVYSISGSTLTKLANPATLPTGTGNCVACSPDDNFVAVGHASSPFFTVYANAAGVLTKLDNPGVALPSSTDGGIVFNSTSDKIYTALASSSNVYSYKISNNKLSRLNPITTISSGYGVAISDDDSYIAIANNTATGAVYKKTALLPDVEFTTVPDVKAYIKTGL